MSEFTNSFKDIFIKYESAKYDFFKWRFESKIVNKLALAVVFACLTGIFAQLRFYLPYTPVPVTGQVFAVLLSGVILGKWYGGISQGLYAALGAAGVPWFNGGKAGLEILTGVTGGYITYIPYPFVSFLTNSSSSSIYGKCSHQNPPILKSFFDFYPVL